MKDIVNVEENHDVLKGDRYLIELVSQCYITNVIWKTLLNFLRLILNLQWHFLSLQELNVEGRSEWFLSK